MLKSLKFTPNTFYMAYFYEICSVLLFLSIYSFICITNYSFNKATDMAFYLTKNVSHYVTCLCNTWNIAMKLSSILNLAGRMGYSLYDFQAKKTLLQAWLISFLIWKNAKFLLFWKENKNGKQSFYPRIH